MIFMISVGLLLLYSIAVLRVPLLNYLGYEYSTAVALFLPIIPGLLFLQYFRRRAGGSGGPGPFATLFKGLGASLLLLSIPLAIGWLNGFFVKNCAPVEGLSYYIMIPAVTMIWTVSLAYFCVELFRRPAPWYILIVIVTLLHPLYLGYATPAIDSYNFIYGYFPGFTYDEDLQITSTLVLFRVTTLISALFFMATGVFARGRRKDRFGVTQSGESPTGGKSAPGKKPTALRILAEIFPRGRVNVILPALLLLVAWFFRVEMGFETTQGRIESVLGSVVETQHFRIVYDSTAVGADEIRWVAAEHEFRFSEVATALEVDTNIVVTSYLYPDSDTKRRLTGAGNTDIAKPWRAEIHLDGDSWKATLKHELVHILAAEFGMSVIRANTNIALVEGLATSMSPSFGNHTLSEYSAAMIRFGIVEDPGAMLNTAGFAFRSSSVSYVLMGSFCEYLIGTYGIDPFKKWYGGKSADSAYGRETETLVGEWKESLRRIRVEESWREHVEYYFRRPSIFAKECARYVANLNREGYRTLREREYGGAMEIFREALSQAWNTSSFTGYMRALLSSGNFNQVVREFELTMSDTMRRKSLTASNFILGDALMMRGDYHLAGFVYRGLYNLHLSPGADQAAALRLSIIADSKLRGYLAPYLVGRMTDTSALLMLEKMVADSAGPVVHFLTAKLRFSKKDYLSVLREFPQFGTMFSFPELNAAADVLYGDAYFRTGEFLAANTFYQRSLTYVKGRAARDRIADRMARGGWFYINWSGMEFRQVNNESLDPPETGTIENNHGDRI